jgi:uncharacterized phage-associated protein
MKSLINEYNALVFSLFEIWKMRNFEGELYREMKKHGKKRINSNPDNSTIEQLQERSYRREKIRKKKFLLLFMRNLER